MHGLCGSLRRNILNVFLLGELDQPQNDAALVDLLDVDIFSDDGIDQGVVRVALLDKLLVQNSAKNLPHLHQLLTV